MISYRMRLNNPPSRCLHYPAKHPAIVKQRIHFDTSESSDNPRNNGQKTTR